MEQELSEFYESDKSLKHELGSIVSHVWLAGAVVAPWPITQEVADSHPFTVMTNI